MKNLIRQVGEHRLNLDSPAGEGDSEGDAKNEYELVAKVYEFLKAAAARNSANL
jgi:hypothetical protein